MRIPKTLYRICGTAAAVLFFALSQTYAASDKIDPAIRAMLRPGASLEAPMARGLVKEGPFGAGPMVRALVKFDRDLQGVGYYGGAVHSVIGDVASVELPLDAVEQISELPNVVFIEAARKLRPRLDVSVPAAGGGVNRVWFGAAPNWTGNTGRNVIVGIVDTGIDLHHKDFQTAAGNTRILSLWDQTAATSSPPAGFSYGHECTAASINTGSCNAPDTEGHGTHVAGIATGNGSATGNGQPAYRYIGMAPEADIVFVKTNFFTTGIIDGISYIQKVAGALNKPAVVNLSLGSHFGPHDGTGVYEQGLSNASGAGNMIVGAGGNEAGANIHASGTVSNGGATNVNFNIPSGTTFELLDIWYAGADTMDITVTKGACSLSQAGIGSNSVNGACGQISIGAANTNAQNGDREIQVQLQNGTNALSSGAWYFTLGGANITTAGRFDAWAAAEMAQFTTHADNNITVIDTCTATNTICAASFNTKGAWNSINGGTFTFGETVGAISSFSSLGPRRTCSTIANCPSIQKPEIAAPGSAIMSALSANTSPAVAQALIDPDGVHRIMEGTSMASPHVAGAVALILQADPTAAVNSIKTLLESNATTDGNTGSTPNDTWGYGKMNAHAAFNAAPNPVPGAPSGLSAITSGASAWLTWTRNTELDLDGYNVYRGTSHGGPYSIKVNSTLIPHNVTFPYNDVTVSVGTQYFYVTRAVDTAGQESGNSNEANVTITNTPPAAPTGLTATASGTNNINLSWTANTEPALAGYNLYRSTTSGSGYTKVNSSLIPKTPTAYSDTTVTGGTTYYYVVRAIDTGSLESGNSNQASATAIAASSPAPIFFGGGGGGGGGFCFIATAAYGSYLDPHVKTLRDFRDNVLLQSAWGRNFVELYYAASPPVARVIAGSPTLRFLTRLALTPLVLAVEYPQLAGLFVLCALMALLVVILMNRARRNAGKA